MRSADGAEREIVVVARVDELDETNLCAFLEDGGAIKASVNARFEDEAIRHIRRHIERGGEGVQLCSRDCRGSELPSGRPAAV